MGEAERAGTLSPRLREIVELLVAEPTEFVRDAMEAIREEIPVYRQLKDAVVVAEIEANIAENAALWYERILEGRPPSDDRLTHLAEFARHRVHQQVPLAQLLHAFRVGAVVLWTKLLDAAEQEPEIQSEVLFDLSREYFVHVDLVSGSTTNAYTTELGKRERWRDRIRQELVTAVFAADADEVAFGDRASVLDIDVSAHYCAIALRVKQPPTGPVYAEPRLWRPIEDLKAALSVNPDSVVEGLRHGHLVLWLPAPAAEREAWEQQTLETVQRVVLDQEDRQVEAVGVGTPGRGLTGWRVAAEQALRALELGGRTDAPTAIHSYADVAVYDLALRTPQIAEFLRGLLERLSDERDLLESVSAYYASGRQLKAAAATLFVHPNTLSYRLRRVESLLNGSLQDPEWTLRLELALRLRRYGG